jgi:acyl-CoA thioester hydrolase
MSRRSRTEYFQQEPGTPLPLQAEVMRKVRFEEVDPLTIVWHGRYPSYFEDGREAFGEKYGLSYMDMYHAKFMAPLAKMHIDYLEPLAFPERFRIITSLHWTEGARLNFSYTIENQDGKICARGYTVQVLTTLTRDVLLIRPQFLEDFFQTWKENRL